MSICHKNGMNIIFFTDDTVLELDTKNGYKKKHCNLYSYHWKVECSINSAKSEKFSFGRPFEVLNLLY